MSFWEKGKRQQSEMRRDKPNALPVFSVNTIEEAEQILVHFGKRHYEGGDYYWFPFSGDYNQLFEITDVLRDYYAKRKGTKSLGGRKDWSPIEEEEQPAPPPEVAEFMDAYIAAALWSSTHQESDEPLDENYESTDIAPATMQKMIEDSLAFIDANMDDIMENMSRAGHDFWLTRNGHGAGFWDGDPWAKDVGERLTQSAHAFGGVDLSVGDDGKIYGSPS